MTTLLSLGSTIEYSRHGELASGMDAADRYAQTAEESNKNRIKLQM